MSDEGASPAEQVFEACRRNNTELLQEIITKIHTSSDKKSAHAKVAQFLNSVTDALGNHCLHLAASSGSYEVLDILLDQEGLEVDPIDRMERDTPLHKSVRFVNELSKTQWESGKTIVELLLDAGADPRTRNKAKLKAIELVDPRNIDLKSTLQKAEITLMAGDDVVHEDDDEGPTGSASDSE
ncbi:MAG: hypothetical protein M1824_005525 [Vezdaea acicularis]|nr:MAG: hypothetical protein M1824_005525 [Vezdaea acicularis]